MEMAFQSHAVLVVCHTLPSTVPGLIQLLPQVSAIAASVARGLYVMGGSKSEPSPLGFLWGLELKV